MLIMIIILNPCSTGRGLGLYGSSDACYLGQEDVKLFNLDLVV